MKTKVEINGYEIAIEEMEGNITVKAQKGGETVEEFTLTPETETDVESESPEVVEPQETQIKGFDQFGEEEEDFGTEDELENEIEEAPVFDEDSEGEIAEPIEPESEETGEETGEESTDEEEVEEVEEVEEKEEVVESLKTFQSFINSKRV